MAFGQYLGYVVGFVAAIVGGVVGFYSGGPAGAAYGATLGFSLGSMVGGVAGQVFWPERADLNLPQPPQPHETRLQFSSWGMAIPIQYGSGRMAGNIIYMSDIKETIERSKHRQDGVRYYEMVRTYTSTFAISFCEGPVPGIARIWMNSKVIADWRDPLGPYFPSGDISLAAINLETTIARSTALFSVYLGSETQTLDPSIVALLTEPETTAYRGLFYIVFKDFPIGEFSGVPNIEVEVGQLNEIVGSYVQYFDTGNWKPYDPAYYTVWSTDHWAMNAPGFIGEIYLEKNSAWVVNYRPTKLRVRINADSYIPNFKVIILTEGWDYLADHSCSVSSGSSFIVIDIIFNEGLVFKDINYLDIFDSDYLVNFTVTNIEFS